MTITTYLILAFNYMNILLLSLIIYINVYYTNFYTSCNFNTYFKQFNTNVYLQLALKFLRVMSKDQTGSYT